MEMFTLKWNGKKNGPADSWADTCVWRHLRRKHRTYLFSRDGLLFPVKREKSLVAGEILFQFRFGKIPTVEPTFCWNALSFCVPFLYHSHMCHVSNLTIVDHLEFRSVTLRSDEFDDAKICQKLLNEKWIYAVSHTHPADTDCQPYAQHVSLLIFLFSLIFVFAA